jgi:FKBP-type peptidyl-prolyl cis-trans isomerase
MFTSASARRWLLVASATALVTIGCASVEDQGPSGTVDPAAPADVKAPPGDAQTTASGLAWKVLTPGTGSTHPRATDQVTVHYTGWTTDGIKFDSSMGKAPAMFFLNRVIDGWTEGVQLMVKGEKSRFWIPSQLAYGDHPRPGYPAGMLVFEIELLEIAP